MRYIRWQWILIIVLVGDMVNPIGNGNYAQVDAEGCPTVVPISQLDIPPFYFVNIGEQPQLKVFQSGQILPIDLVLTPTFFLQPLPNGKHILYATDQGTGSDYVFSLFTTPLTQTPTATLTTTETDVSPYFYWIDDSTLRFYSQGQRAELNIIDDTRVIHQQQLEWPEDIWNHMIWGRIVDNLSLDHYVYATNRTLNEDVPNYETGLALLRLVSVSEPETHYPLLLGYIDTVVWFPDNETFLYQEGDYAWYQVQTGNIQDITSLFNSYIDARNYHPSIAPDGQTLAVLQAIPGEEHQEELLLLSQDTLPVDLCIYGNISFELTYNANSVSGVWSPDSNYLAFEAFVDGQSGLYVYDAEHHQIALMTTLESGIITKIVGWGNNNLPEANAG